MKESECDSFLWTSAQEWFSEAVKNLHEIFQVLLLKSVCMVYIVRIPAKRRSRAKPNIQWDWLQLLRVKKSKAKKGQLQEKWALNCL
jgi:hypothetical protein